MRDPRLAEIEFLAWLERTPTWVGQVRGLDLQSKFFGMTAVAFKQLLLALASDGGIGGPEVALIDKGRPSIPAELNPHFPMAADAIDTDRTKTMNDIWLEQDVSVSISHAGRLRLWRLRDEMLRDRLRDDFGILWAKRHWLPDLSLRLTFREPATPFTVMRLDLDHFKQVNDKINHAAGDDALKAYMRIVLDKTAPTGGEAYRLGGDEAGVILPGVKHEDALALAEKMRLAIFEELKALHVHGVTPSASIGVATFAGDINAEDAEGAADQLAYAAKNNGRNRVEGANL
jgi:diguanylate cyclase (GGDEF)-like protein